MNKKQLVLDSIHNKETERVPWVPFVGCHAASLIGVTADEYFIDADLIVKGVKKAYEEYDPDGLPVLLTCRWRRRLWAVNWFTPKTIHLQ